MSEEINKTEEQPQETRAIPDLLDRRKWPEGVVPKQSQTYLIVGLSVLILLAVLFSNKHAQKPVEKPSAAGAPVVSTDANQRKIEELKQELSSEQKQVSSSPAPSAAASSNTAPANAATLQQQQMAYAPQPTGSSTPQQDPVKEAEKALNFKSRFASNLLSKDSPIVSAPTVSNATESPASSQTTTKAANTTVNVNSAYGQPYVLFEGTMLDTALVNRLDGEFSGPIKVMVTNPVYSQDRQHVLIPEGSFLLGGVQKVSGFGQKRLAVTFHRLLMPDGYSVDLDQFHGLDAVGETGLKDKVNNHYMQIFGASIALGVIAGAAESSTNSGVNESGSDAYRQGVASSLSQSSTTVLDRFISVQPTITIREGHRIKVYFTQDLLLPAYERHTVPPNI